MLDRYAAFLEALRAHFRDKEIRPLEVLKAAKENQALGVALIACVPSPNALRIGKLFSRCRGKSYGDCILEGSIDAHTKSWVYTVSPYAPKKPSKIEAAQADLNSALEIAEAAPYEQLSAKELEQVCTGKEGVIERVQREKDEEVQRAQRALDRVKIATDPDLQATRELLQRNKEQRRALARAGSIHESLQSGNSTWLAEEEKKAAEARAVGHHGTAQRIEHEAAHKQRMQKPRPQWSMAELEAEKDYQRSKNTPGGHWATSHSHPACSWGFGDPRGVVSQNIRNENGSTNIFGWPNDSI